MGDDHLEEDGKNESVGYRDRQERDPISDL